MGLFGHKERDQEIIIIENLTINECDDKPDHHHKHDFTSYFSSVTFNNKNTVKGKIMATTFKKAEKVSYVIAFADVNGATAPIQPGSLSIQSSDTNIANVVPDPANELQGEVLGVNDGNATISWAALSLGGATISGTADITVADEAPPVEAVSTTITFGAPTPQ